MPMTQITDLTPYGRSKAIAQARAWRMENHPKILLMLRIEGKTHVTGVVPERAPPEGYKIFLPDMWEAHNWRWLSELIIEELNRKSGRYENLVWRPAGIPAPAGV